MQQMYFVFGLLKAILLTYFGFHPSIYVTTLLSFSQNPFTSKECYSQLIKSRLLILYNLKAWGAILTFEDQHKTIFPSAMNSICRFFEDLESVFPTNLPYMIFYYYFIILLFYNYFITQLQLFENVPHLRTGPCAILETGSKTVLFLLGF